MFVLQVSSRNVLQASSASNETTTLGKPTNGRARILRRVKDYMQTEENINHPNTLLFRSCYSF